MADSGRSMSALADKPEAKMSRLVLTIRNAPGHVTRVVLTEIFYHPVEDELPDRFAIDTGRATAPTPKHSQMIDGDECGDLTKPIKASTWIGSATGKIECVLPAKIIRWGPK